MYKAVFDRVILLVLLLFSSVLLEGCNVSSGVDLRLVAVDLKEPRGIKVDKTGNLLVAESGMDRIISIDQGGMKRIVATGIPSPEGLAMGSMGEIYVSSREHGLVHKINRSGDVSIMAKGLSEPVGLLVDRDGSLLVTENRAGRILRISPSGEVFVVAKNLAAPVDIGLIGDGYAVCCRSGVVMIGKNGDVRSSRNVCSGLCLACGPEGGLYLANGMTGDICRVGEGCKLHTCAKNFLYGSAGLDFDRDGNLFASTCDGDIYRISSLHD